MYNVKCKTFQGYTLAEILIAISVLVVLGITALVGINPIAQIFKGYDAHRRDDLNKIKTALENYYSDHEQYPLFPLVNADNKPTYICESDFLKPYLSAMPCDPSKKTPYIVYLSPPDSSSPQDFVVYAHADSLSDENPDAITNCPDTIVVHSPSIDPGELEENCGRSGSGKPACTNNHYGCVNYSCQKISGPEEPGCTPNYCTSNCDGEDCSLYHHQCK